MYNYFPQQYGDIEYTQVVRDRNSGENKGFGYVKFHRPYHAAVALESCDPCKEQDFRFFAQATLLLKQGNLERKYFCVVFRNSSSIFSLKYLLCPLIFLFYSIFFLKSEM